METEWIKRENGYGEFLTVCSSKKAAIRAEADIVAVPFPWKGGARPGRQVQEIHPVRDELGIRADPPSNGFSPFKLPPARQGDRSQQHSRHGIPHLCVPLSHEFSISCEGHTVTSARQWNLIPKGPEADGSFLACGAEGFTVRFETKHTGGGILKPPEGAAMNTEWKYGSPGLEKQVRLLELLAGYLLASPWLRRPGADGATVEEVVAAEYPVASAAGSVPDQHELIRRHPELTDAIVVFFTF